MFASARRFWPVATYLRNPAVTPPLPPLTVPEFKFRGRTSP